MITTEQVLAIRDDLVARGRVGAEVVQGVRTEVHALLQLEYPAPPESEVTDAHRIMADHARKTDPMLKDAHHFLQKAHQTNLWQQTDKIVSDAGVR